VLFVLKNFFHLNLRGGSPEKFFSFSFFRQHFWGKYEKNMEKLEKIWKNWKNMAPW
jgi:hypothetical protein